MKPYITIHQSLTINIISSLTFCLVPQWNIFIYHTEPVRGLPQVTFRFPLCFILWHKRSLLKMNGVRVVPATFWVHKTFIQLFCACYKLKTGCRQRVTQAWLGTHRHAQSLGNRLLKYRHPRFRDRWMNLCYLKTEHTWEIKICCLIPKDCRWSAPLKSSKHMTAWSISLLQSNQKWIVFFSFDRTVLKNHFWGEERWEIFSLWTFLYCHAVSIFGVLHCDFDQIW